MTKLGEILTRPFRTRYPGTIWELNTTTHACSRCGAHYNDHGAPLDVAKLLGVPDSERHLICKRRRPRRPIRLWWGW